MEDNVETVALSQLEQVEFQDNPEPRCPVVLLLDTSGSMAGKPIDELNAGLQDFQKARPCSVRGL